MKTIRRILKYFVKSASTQRKYYVKVGYIIKYLFIIDFCYGISYIIFLILTQLLVLNIWALTKLQNKTVLFRMLLVVI